MSRAVHFLTACTFALLLISSQVQAAMITLDFDSFAPASVIDNSTFDAIGIHFDTNLQVVEGSQLQTGRPGNAVRKHMEPGGTIEGEFIGPVETVDSISVLAGDFGEDEDTVTLIGYNAALDIVDEATFTDFSAQSLSISGSGIQYFRIISSEGSRFAIDDFSFTPENDSPAVPEPSSLVLLGIGLGCSATVSRRRRRVTNAS